MQKLINVYKRSNFRDTNDNKSDGVGQSKQEPAESEGNSVDDDGGLAAELLGGRSGHQAADQGPQRDATADPRLRALIGGAIGQVDLPKKEKNRKIKKTKKNEKKQKTMN